MSHVLAAGVLVGEKKASALIRRSVQNYLKRGFSFDTQPQTPLLTTFDPFLQQIKHHGEGSITVSSFPQEKILDVVIDNSMKRNCLTGRMIYQLLGIIDSLSADSRYSDAVVLILRGAGSSAEKEVEGVPCPASFCAGLDFSLAKDIINTPEQGLQMCTMMTEALNRLKSLNMISVALIHGPALGGGAELATACDFRIITDDASSRIGFVHGKLGASPGWGGGRRLFDIVGRSQSLRLLGTARILTPLEAQEARLVDSVLTSPSAPSALSSATSSQPLSYLDQGELFAAPFVNMPYPGAVKDMKSLVAGLSAESGAEDSRQLEKDIFRRRWGSADNRAALSKK